MTSTPPSRRARATTLAPRSWPSRPTFATRTLSPLTSVGPGGGGPPPAPPPPPRPPPPPSPRPPRGGRRRPHFPPPARRFPPPPAGAGPRPPVPPPPPLRRDARADSADPFAPNAWLAIAPDGTVTVTMDRSEMGQGAPTALAMLVAEELEADWATVRLGTTVENPAAWSRRMLTGGSSSVRTSYEPLRKAGAAAREMP